MPYKYLNLEFHRREDLYDLEKSIDVFTTFVEALGENIKGANFNKYDPTRLQVRFDVKDEKTEIAKSIVFDVAKGLQEKRNVKEYDKELTDWIEPYFVILGHEVGAACALELRNWMKQNPVIYEHLQKDPRKKVGFMAQLLHLIFQRVGFSAPLMWGILRESPTYNKDALTHAEQINCLVEACIAKLEKTLKNIAKEHIPDFFERFVHAFFNCIFTNAGTYVKLSIEGQVLSYLLTSLLWRHIATPQKER